MPIDEELTEIELGYAAGLIDGEGCIHVQKVGASNCRAGFYFRVQVTVDMVNVILPYWMQQHFGGWVSKKKPAKQGYRDHYCWTVTSWTAHSFLKQVLPYLKLKTLQAKYAMEFQELKQRASYIGQVKSPIILEAEAVLQAKINVEKPRRNQNAYR